MTASSYSACGCIAILCAFAILPSTASSQDYDDDELPEFLPGLVAEIDLPSLGTVKRIDQDVQFDWNSTGADLRADSKSPIKASWTGFLESKESGRFKIHAFAAGRIRVRLDDKQILESQSDSPRWFHSQPTELKFGRHPIEIEYEGNGVKRQIGLYWSGPQFELEPIPQRYFSHRSEITIDDSFDRGVQFSRALGCVVCHKGSDSRRPLPAPALTRLEGNLKREWLVERLTAKQSIPSQRMPHVGLESADAEAIAATLLAASQPSPASRKYQKPIQVR